MSTQAQGTTQEAQAQEVVEERCERLLDIPQRQWTSDDHAFMAEQLKVKAAAAKAYNRGEITGVEVTVESTLLDIRNAKGHSAKDGRKYLFAVEPIRFRGPDGKSYLTNAFYALEEPVKAEGRRRSL